MKKTDWFPPEVKPVHVGVYETHIGEIRRHSDFRAQWDGDFWRWGNGEMCVLQRRAWRGLAEKPA